MCKPTEHWDLPPAWGILRRRLEADNGTSRGTRQFIGILRLLEKHTMHDLTQAVQQGLSLGAITADAIAVIVQGQDERPKAIFSLEGRPHLSCVHVAQPDLHAYSQLLSGGAA